MVITPGTRLGPYEITTRIGIGGMGEVYKATDTNLKRAVAIKVLPASVADDPDRLARFQREAEVLAQLNHPNIAAIHGLEKSDDHTALVMELVEGPTLADRIKEGPIPEDEALRIAQQIAEALAAAHEQGIIHRDLKPANIKIKADGTVKVLDFGLAKAMEPAGAAPSTVSQLPTMTAPAMTQMGAILGTPGYMSPEQARGLPSDKRADVWAFGCVLYEMLAGSRAFGGDRTVDPIASVMSDEPKWSLLPSSTRPAVRRVLRRCLVKDPRARLRDLGDAHIDLQEALATPAIDDTTAQSPAHARGVWRRVATWVVVIATAGVAGGVAVWNVMRNVPVQQAPGERLAIIVPAAAARTGPQAALTALRGLAISPDGKTVVYVGPSEGRGTSRLYVRSLDAFEPRALEGTDGASAPFFSPDSQSVAFFAAGRLKRTPVFGGTVATICDAPEDTSGGSGGTWGPDDTIVFASPTSARTGLYRVSAYGGTPEVLTTPDPADEGGHGDPAFIPGTDAIVFTTRLTKAGVPPAVVVYSLKTAEQHKLAVDGFAGAVAEQMAIAAAAPSLSRPQYTLTGHLVLRRGFTIVAVPFRPDTLEITGAVAPIVEEAADFAVSAGGRLVYVGAPSYGGQLVWVDRRGAIEPILDSDQKFGRPRLSPDGSQLTVEVLRAGRSDIGVLRFSSRVLTLLTTDGLSNSPGWYPDGKRIAFRVPGGLMWRSADGTGSSEVLLAASDPVLGSSSSVAPGVFSLTDPSAFIFVVHGSAATSADIFRLHIGPDRRIEPLVQGPGNQWAARESPDGRWISYASDETGRFEIYVVSSAGGHNKHQVSIDGGSEAVWSRAGNELFYRVEDRMMAVPVTKNPDLPVGVPRVLFTGEYQRTDLPQYDVTPDGQRFVMVRPTLDEMDARTIRVVEGWVDELRERGALSR